MKDMRRLLCWFNLSYVLRTRWNRAMYFSAVSTEAELGRRKCAPSSGEFFGSRAGEGDQLLQRQDLEANIS